MGVGILVATWLHISLVTAFYPYIPEYRCLEDLSCASTSKRSTLYSEHTQDAPLVFHLEQRIPEETLPHDSHIKSVLARLVSKYNNRGDHSHDTVHYDKRSNDYSIVAANTPSQSNSAALNQDGTDFSYFASVKFGSSGKSLYMLMDTGADSTWVMTSGCTSDACTKHNTFGSSDSTSLQVSNTAFSIQYGSGSVTGKYATDNLAIAGMTLNATFGLASTTSSDFLSFPFDGIMGLARSSSPPGFIDTLVASKQLKSNIFSININRNSDGAKDGEITFGGIDTSKFTGSLTYSAVSGTSGAWVIPVDDIGVNGKKSGLTGKTAYIDTGTSYAFIPPADLVALYANIPGASLGSDGMTYSVPCSTTTPLQFYFSGVTYTVLAKDWVGGKVGDSCTSNVYARAIVGSSWLIGDIFLKNVYAVFDVDQNRIGLAQKSGSSASATSSPTASAAASSSGKISSLSPIQSSISTSSPDTTQPEVVSKTQDSPASTSVSVSSTPSSSVSTSLSSKFDTALSNGETTATSISQTMTSSSAAISNTAKSAAVSWTSSTTSASSASGKSTSTTSSAAPFVNVPTSTSATTLSSPVRASDAASANIAATAAPSAMSSAHTLNQIDLFWILVLWPLWLVSS